MSTVAKLGDVAGRAAPGTDGSSETRNAIAGFLALLAVTTAHTLLETARDASFLAVLPASHLPWMYLAIVACALVVSQLRLVRADGKRAIATTLLVGAAVTACFWSSSLFASGALFASGSHGAIYGLYVWTGVFGSAATAAIWTLLSRVHTMTQAKRRYGFIGGGAILGSIAGAGLARVAVSFAGPQVAILLASIIFAVAALPLVFIRVPAVDPQPITAGAMTPPQAGVAPALSILGQNALARRVLYIVVLSTTTLTIADYVFKARLAERLTDPRALAEWLSGFNAITNALALVAQFVIAPWVFRRLGVRRALFVFPTAMLLASAVAFVSAGAQMMKALDGTLRFSLHKTSTELLLVPLPADLRDRVKPLIDLVGARSGQALASLGILAFGAAASARPVLTVATTALCFVWLVLAFALRGRYVDTFRETYPQETQPAKIAEPSLSSNVSAPLFASVDRAVDETVASFNPTHRISARTHASHLARRRLDFSTRDRPLISSVSAQVDRLPRRPKMPARGRRDDLRVEYRRAPNRHARSPVEADRSSGDPTLTARATHRAANPDRTYGGRFS